MSDERAASKEGFPCHLPLVGQQVVHLDFAFPLRLIFSSGAQLAAQVEFSAFAADGRNLQLFSGDDPGAEQARDVIVGSKVEDAVLFDDGRLLIEFDSGVQLRLEKSEFFEGWLLTASDGEVIAEVEGRELTVGSSKRVLW